MSELPFTYVFTPIFYYDLVTGLPVSVKGIGGSMSVIMSGWDGALQTLIKTDASGNLAVTTPVWSSEHLAANATTTVKNAAGTLRGVVINTYGNASNTVTIKDNATVLAVITGGAFAPDQFDYNIAFATSLVITIAGGTPGDITVLYQ